MKRKIFLTVLAVVSVSIFVNNSFASEVTWNNLDFKTITFDLIDSRAKLEETEKWREFIEKIDERVQNLSEEELLKFQKILDNYLKTYKRDYYDIFKYFKAKIDHKILNWNSFSEINTDKFITYVNKNKTYKVSSKKDEDILVKKDVYEHEVDISFVNLNSGSSVSVATEDYSQTSLKNLKEYFGLSVELIEKEFKLKDLTKEAVEINGSKWYKVSYELTNDKTNLTMKLEQYIFENDKKLAYIITKWTILGDDEEYKLDEIVNSFKILK